MPETPLLARIRQAWVNTDDAPARLTEVHMSPPRFLEIIRGQREPTSLDLALMATAFRVTVQWLTDYQPQHVPVTVHDRSDPEKIAPPAEVCEACSDLDNGKLVPVTFCEEAKSKMEPAPWADPC
jgi:hypothetical protein